MNIIPNLSLLEDIEQILKLLKKVVILLNSYPEISKNIKISIVSENIFKIRQIKTTFRFQIQNENPFEYYLFYEGNEIGEFYSKTNLKGYLENSENDFGKNFDEITPNEIYNDFLDEYYLFKEQM